MFCQKEITGDIVWEELSLPGKILFTDVLQSASLISTTIGLFHPWEGSCSIGRELCGAKALRLKWEDTTHRHTQVAPDRGAGAPSPPPPRTPLTPPGSQALRAREEKQKQFQLLSSICVWDGEGPAPAGPAACTLFHGVRKHNANEHPGSVCRSALPRQREPLSNPGLLPAQHVLPFLSGYHPLVNVGLPPACSLRSCF